MSQVRKLQRRNRAGSLGQQLSQAVGQVAGLNTNLGALPKILEEVQATHTLLDTLRSDYQTLRTELRFTQWILRREIHLTPEREAQYRQEFKETDSG